MLLHINFYQCFFFERYGFETSATPFSVYRELTITSVGKRKLGNKLIILHV